MTDWPAIDFGHTAPDAAFQRGDVYDVGVKADRAAKRRLRIGIAGCGGVAQAKWLPAIRRLQTIGEPVDIVGVTDANRENADKMAALGGTTAYPDLVRLIADGAPDLILILASDAAHGPLAREAIDAGIACLVEKPLTRTFAEATDLVRLAAERNVALAAVANKRFSPPYAMARALVERGALHTAPTVFTGKFTLGYGYVDILEGGTVHLIDLMLWFMGPVGRIHARGIDTADGRLESAVVSFAFESGAIGTIMTSTAGLSFKPWERVEIFGRNAFIVVDDQIETTLHDEETGPAKSWRPTVPNTLMFDESFGGYSGLLENVLDAVRGLAPLGTSGADGAAAVGVIEAIRLSLAEKREIDMAAEGARAVKITKLETFLANAGQRNYLFVRLTTDTGLTGVGEATLEWQERAVEVLLNEWVASRIIGKDPFDIEAVVGDMIRDQYQGGSTVMTAISSAEIAMWDIIGKATGQPVYRLIGGRAKRELFAYANGWYGGCETPVDFAARAREVVGLGYQALKFDPFTTAWKILDREQEALAHAIVAAVAEAVGPEIGLMIEIHGRLGAGDAVRFIDKLDGFNIHWCEEPVAPENVELLREVKDRTALPISSGERLYTMVDFARLVSLRAADIVQMDVAHCGGIAIAKKIAALAATQDMAISPHCSIGPVALAAALHVAWSTPNMLMLESFAEFDVDWRDSLVGGWNPLEHGRFSLPDEPGLGLDIDLDAIAAHPYKPLAFPSLWDTTWRDDFTGTAKLAGIK